jgi:quercetin dioxygenase-like cupin family protein
MKRTSAALAALVLCGLVLAAHDEPARGRPPLKTLSQQGIAEKVDGKEARAMTVELTLEPGRAGAPHRHPGPVFGYVIEGQYEWAINDQPSRVLKAGETFYEPTGYLHRVSKIPGQARTRVLAILLHPHDTKQLAVPEPSR